MIVPDAAFPFDDTSFDVMFSTQVLENVERLEHTVSEIDGACKPGGMKFLYEILALECQGVLVAQW